MHGHLTSATNLINMRQFPTSCDDKALYACTNLLFWPVTADRSYLASSGKVIVYTGTIAKAITCGREQ
jgi:hypothetical protein